MADFIFHIAEHTPKNVIIYEIERAIDIWKQNQTEENWEKIEAHAYLIMLKASIENHGGTEAISKRF
jgi:hypothetical protein